jgi:transcriptional regulator with XRE-family HTH domain
MPKTTDHPKQDRYRRLLEDFVIGDRRIAERHDLEVGLGGDGLLWVSFQTGVEPGSEESDLLSLLAAMVACSQFDAEVRYLNRRASRSVGKALAEVRNSLRLSADDIADQVGTTGFAVSNWEHGVNSPDSSQLYQWCQVLDLVCPPKSALVRVVDFPPELLRFLHEDPTRLQSLTPDQFERFVAERMDRMGYNVTLTGETNRKDGGIDLIAVPKLASLGSYVIAGQVKHHRGDQTTGVDAVDRLLAWKDSVFRAGLLVTNTSFTKDAVWKAHKDGNAHFLRLRDFTDLKRWLQDQYGSDEDWREIPDRIELAPGIVVEIPRPRITSSSLGRTQN